MFLRTYQRPTTSQPKLLKGPISSAPEIVVLVQPPILLWNTVRRLCGAERSTAHAGFSPPDFEILSAGRQVVQGNYRPGLTIEPLPL